MRLEPLYRLTFHYPEAWFVELEGERGVESEHFLIAEGRCEGRVAGRFRGANHPRRRTDLTYLPDFQGLIETDDGAVLMVDLRGRAAPEGHGRIVAFCTHVASDERYRWLNDGVCAVAGEVRGRREGRVEIVLDVATLVWEPLGD